MEEFSSKILLGHLDNNIENLSQRLFAQKSERNEEISILLKKVLRLGLFIFTGRYHLWNQLPNVIARNRKKLIDL